MKMCPVKCLAAAGLVLLIVCAVFLPGEAPPKYVVAAEASAMASPEWQQVVDALRRRHRADVVTYEAGKEEALLPALRARRPRWVCFVTPPEKAGRALVVSAAQLLRRIDDDPYGDALWGIVTGYDPSDALRLVAPTREQTIRRVATSMGGPKTLDDWESGFASDEGNANRLWVKRPGGSNEEKAVSPDPARELATAFNTIPVDYWVTSGHATERNWQIIYNKNKGFFVHVKDRLMARASNGWLTQISAPDPKVYIAAGNCLIGHVDRRECMATAWIRSGGVVQMAGYTVPSFYGFMGWGMKGLFESTGATPAEAHFFTNQQLLWALGRRNPALRDLTLAPDALASMHAFRDFARQRNVPGGDPYGLLWDRDTFAFLGDPARIVRFPSERRAWDVAVKRGKITVTFLRDMTFASRGDARGYKPLGVLLDAPPAPGATLRGADGTPVPEAVVTELFALIPLDGTFKKGTTRVFSYPVADASTR
jgi:zinc protease